MERPIILFTNDDGIKSPGLWAAVKAFDGLGELLVVAPCEQQSGMGRSMPMLNEGRIYKHEIPVEDLDCEAYAVEGSPAQTVQHAMLELAKRKPALVVSGINYGENVGSGVTISGTVGAAMEGASFGIPSLAASVQTPFDMHMSNSDEVDFGPATYFTRKFGQWLMKTDSLPNDVYMLKLDLPMTATLETEWRITRVSRRRVFWPVTPEREKLSDAGRIGYRYHGDPSLTEPDSDIHTVLHDKLVSVTPMSLDLTSRADFSQLREMLVDGMK